MARTGKTKEDWNALKLGFLKTVHLLACCRNKLFACNFKNNAQETYLFVSDLWFCHLHVISLLTLSSIVIEGEWLAKLNKNKLECCDTVPLSWLLVTFKCWHPSDFCARVLTNDSGEWDNLCNELGVIISESSIFSLTIQS